MSTKSALRIGVAELLRATGLTTPRRWARERLSIATFHRVLPEAQRNIYPYPGLVVTPEELEQLLGYFTEHFDCGSLVAQHRRYLGNDLPVRPLLAITFDDAQHDNYLHARPALARHDLRASFFVPVIGVETQELLWHDKLGFALLDLLSNGETGRNLLLQIASAAGVSTSGPGSLPQNIVGATKKLPLDRRLSFVNEVARLSGPSKTPQFARLMTFDEISRLAADGHEIGSHSMTHCLLPECDDAALAYELAESRRILENRIGGSVESFCYPNGDADSRTALAAANAGYRRAVTTNWGSNSRLDDRFLLRRYNMDAARVCDSSGKLIHSVLAWRMSGLYPGL